ncbi:hypothetical protein BS47DRAFT_2766 [Hydnum rufescens UP504]|uniref:Conserved oligomeric Golgi complex subunit 3 n=1 Tax=Hydnum rufescens UP504 TaxID=1448309 RepID=A0A9P6E2R8_9AGAM|nr:hypothetical protein BS47DRAFT_2766 [Hydnum rufescens UP504]
MAVRRRADMPALRPSSPTPAKQQPPQLSMEEWESKAPISDAAIQSISTLKRACEHRPLPLKFTEESDYDPHSRPSTPKTNPLSRPGTPSNANGNKSSLSSAPNPHHPLHPVHPITTPQQFYDWFSIVERTLSHAQESHFHNYLSTISDHLARCDAMLEGIEDVENCVKDMLKEWRGVEDGADSLQAACERLLEERDRLLDVTDAIALRMEYYQELEHATRMLNHPGDALVLQTDFLLMVERVDVCIEYFQDHRHFTDAEVYLLRFQHCMVRAMTLIKMYFVGTLKALAADVQRRMADKDLSETAKTHLLYAKFSSLSGPTAPLLAELERRAGTHPDDLSSLLSECHTAYFVARKALIAGRLTNEIRMLDPGKSDLVELTRAGCSYLKQLCMDEFDLYRRFFNSGEERLYRYLEGLCDYLYDDLRPRILHEPQLTVLCEVCTVLQALMVLDVPSTYPHNPTSASSSDEDLTLLPSDDMHSHPHDRTIASRLISFVGAGGPQTAKPLRRLHISHLLQMILQDAETRLFFKAQAVIQAEIRHFSPAKVDLDYPQKLIAFRKERLDKPGETPESPLDGSTDELFETLSSRDSMPTWYPTVQKLHWILSLLHDFVKPAIFDDMANDAISTCRQSLISTAQLVGTQSSDQDARLFLVRHLLVLKEMANILSAKRAGIQTHVSETKVAPTATGIFLPCFVLSPWARI